MLLKIAAVAAAIPLSLLGVFVGTGIVLVDVREGGPQGHHVIVPVPIVLAQAAASFVPVHKTRIDLGEARQFLPGAEKVVTALAEGPDGEYVRVEEKNQLVVVRKIGDRLDVRVEGDRENVRVTVPLHMAREMVRELQSSTLRPAALVGALHHARFTQIAEVHDGDTHVSVRVF